MSKTIREWMEDNPEAVAESINKAIRTMNIPRPSDNPTMALILYRKRILDYMEKRLETIEDSATKEIVRGMIEDIEVL